MIKVLSIFGTRPEAIKMAPVIAELKRHADLFVSRVCVTAQHREMLDQILTVFEIAPDYDLNLMQPNQTLEQLTARILVDLPPILRAERPDWVLVQGDTTTVMASSISAFYSGIPIGHIEAGLRTYDKKQPFPEEINRRITSVIADRHFAPTQQSSDNLLREGVATDSILVTGNPVIDALRWASTLPYEVKGGPLATVPWERRIILVTAHRRENFGEPIRQICAAIYDLAKIYENDVHFVYPVHLNPNIREPVYTMLADIKNISLIPPLDYLPFIHLMKRSYLVLTDSGGIQEEAPGLGKPVLVLRNTTERPEAVAAGTARLVGHERSSIVSAVRRLIDNKTEYEAMANAVNPYGDGYAAQRIVTSLLT